MLLLSFMVGCKSDPYASIQKIDEKQIQKIEVSFGLGTLLGTQIKSMVIDAAGDLPEVTVIDVEGQSTSASMRKEDYSALITQLNQLIENAERCSDIAVHSPTWEIEIFSDGELSHSLGYNGLLWINGKRFCIDSGVIKDTTELLIRQIEGVIISK
jgi:hypothetical protein